MFNAQRIMELELQIADAEERGVPEAEIQLLEDELQKVSEEFDAYSKS